MRKTTIHVGKKDEIIFGNFVTSVSDGDPLPRKGKDHETVSGERLEIYSKRYLARRLLAHWGETMAVLKSESFLQIQIGFIT